MPLNFVPISSQLRRARMKIKFANARERMLSIRLQDFYNGGERDLLMEEISALREQVVIVDCNF